jgi:hypothetical protein
MLKKGDEIVMENGTNKNVISKNGDNIEENKNSFNDIKMFLQLLLVSVLIMLYISGRQMIFEDIDGSPVIASIRACLKNTSMTISTRSGWMPHR